MQSSIRAAALTIVLVACAGPTTVDELGAPTTVSTLAVEPRESSPGVMAAAIRRLITHDHTFGQGPPPFTEYLVQTHVDPSAGTAGDTVGDPPRALTEDEREAIETVVEPFGPIRWIDDPAEWRTQDLRPMIEGSVILGVGEPDIQGDTAVAPVSLWCGGLCGTWLTYRVERTDGLWTVTGTEGPIAIS